jgi:hypothetical protein
MIRLMAARLAGQQTRYLDTLTAACAAKVAATRVLRLETVERPEEW